MRISDWSSDVCSSDLSGGTPAIVLKWKANVVLDMAHALASSSRCQPRAGSPCINRSAGAMRGSPNARSHPADMGPDVCRCTRRIWMKRSCESCAETSRSEEHTSELQSLMRSSYAVFCLKKKKRKNEK